MFVMDFKKKSFQAEYSKAAKVLDKLMSKMNTISLWFFVERAAKKLFRFYYSGVVKSILRNGGSPIAMPCTWWELTGQSTGKKTEEQYPPFVISDPIQFHA